MARILISEQVRNEAAKLIDAFNKKTFKGSTDYMYIPVFKGSFLYLNRKEFDRISPVARLQYTGHIKKWNFAIFKWSSEKYDPDEWFFPGEQYVDGTITGAMKAGLDAYPI